MRIQVDQQHFLSDGSQRRAQIDCRRGLADAALLIGNGQHPHRFFAVIGHA
ncbi:MAG: hypothetical protein WDN06_03900 [Asticcacaulis sp.]